MVQKISLAIFAAIIINLLFWETFIRLFIASPSTQIYDRDLGYNNKPHSTYIESKEGYAVNHFNSLGFNDLEVEPQQNVNGKKIIFIGDSYTAALQVSISKNYCQILEKKLNPSYNPFQTDIIKIAREAFIPAHYPVIAKRYFPKLKPDLVVIQLGAHTKDDLYGARVKVSYDEQLKIVSLSPQPRLEDSLKDNFRYFINNSTLIYLLIRKYKPLLMENITTIKSFFQSSKTQNITEKKRDHSFDDATKRLSFIIDDIAKYGSKIIVLYLPAPNGTKGVKKGGETLSLIKKICKTREIPIIDMEANFQNSYLMTKKLPYGFNNTYPGEGHLNTHGHLLTADTLYTYIKNH